MRFFWQARLARPVDVPNQEPVHDGDTLWLQVDRGDRDWSLWSVRLGGPLEEHKVWAPELGKPWAEDCRVELIRWVMAAPLWLRWPLQLETFKVGDGERKSFERYLGVVSYSDMIGETANTVMRRFTAAAA